jgi:protein-tyrosine phosphatase
MAAILLVCTANICRSPMAEVVFKSRSADFGPGAAEVFKTVASAGVHADPRGGPVDARAAAALARHKYSIDKKWRSRRVTTEDFERFDLVLAMEADHVEALRAACKLEQREKICLLLDFVPEMVGRDLPDPYFGPAQGFDTVIDLIERGVQGVGAAWRSGQLKLS